MNRLIHLVGNDHLQVIVPATLGNDAGWSVLRLGSKLNLNFQRISQANLFPNLIHGFHN